jgi:hypothetical protein
MTDWPAMAKGPTKASLDKLMTAGLYIGIFADRYGYIEDGYDKSITELEFDCAEQCGVERLCFVHDGVEPLSAGAEPNPALLQRFKERVNKCVVARFGSVDDFRVKLATAIKDLTLRHTTAGLNALIEMMEAPVARGAVWQIRNDLRETSKQLQGLNNHKRIHEALHDLQFQCYEPVIAARKRTSQDMRDPDLERYEYAFIGIIERLKSVPRILENGNSIWMGRLERAQALFSDAIRTGDARLCDEAINKLSTVLAVFPSIVNDRIAQVTQSLSLADLAHALSGVLERLQQYNTDERRMRDFRRSIGELVNLSMQVKAMVEVHSRWQSLDTLLRGVNSTIGKDTSDLEAVWASITQSVEVLEQEPTLCVTKLALTYRKLAAQLEQGNTEMILHDFDTFRWFAGQLFHRADVELKALCHDLRDIGNSVKKILDFVDTTA